MVYGYIRISTNKQDGTNQRKAIKDFLIAKGYSDLVIVEETISGCIPWEKRKLRKILDKMETGDVIVVSEISRLGRSMLEVMEILSMVMKKEVTLYAIKGNYELGDNIQSKVLAFAFSLAGEIERELISARTKEALARKKTEGIILGRPVGSLGRKKLDRVSDDVMEMLERGVPFCYVAKFFEVSRMTLNRFMKEHNIRRKVTLDFSNLLLEGEKNDCGREEI